MSLNGKYRPKDFDTVLGQSFVSDTLRLAIKGGKTVGAYLFCGPRGTGKTSLARILAKTVNCQKQKKSGNPCLECEICKGFDDGKLVDIIEIDAASHTGVDNIRDIIEKAQFQPTHTKMKVYIIDEVHMLSKGAFNALLKILEEPPTHVMFILATTEVHKIPDTIISRCQRFDFKRIGKEEIVQCLQFVAEKEIIIYDEDALRFIADSSNGGLRDAISLFEQYVNDGKVEYQLIAKNLGLVSDNKKSTLLKKLEIKDTSVIDEYYSIVDSGVNIKVFFQNFIIFIKDELISRMKKNYSVDGIIPIIEELNLAYIRSKNSFDEHIPYIIALTKLVSKGEGKEAKEEKPVEKKESQPKIIEENEKPEVQKKKEVTPLPKETPKVEKNKEEKKEKEPEISSTDVESVFGDEEESEGEKDSRSFDIKQLVDLIAKEPKKAFLVMGIKEAVWRISDGKLYIKPKNNFMFEKVNTSENKELLGAKLKGLGFQLDVEIEG